MNLDTCRRFVKHWRFPDAFYSKENSGATLTSLNHLTSIISYTNGFGFKTAGNCRDAQNLPDATVLRHSLVRFSREGKCSILRMKIHPEVANPNNTAS